MPGRGAAGPEQPGFPACSGDPVAAPTGPSTDASPFDFYRRHVGRFSTAERSELAQTKRFLECVLGDEEFRSALAAGEDTARQACLGRGLQANPADLEPIWRHGTVFEVPTEEAGRYPAVALWIEWLGGLLRFRDLLREHGRTPACNPAFDAWRLRQIARGRRELGHASAAITHPVIAFELSKGCTFGCWFCGISAAGYEGHFPYDGGGRALWRDVLASAATLLGPAMQTGTCYWATDPSDNPDYTRFLDDYREITGALPQTTTAGAIRDVRWTREVLAQAASGAATPTRFSVLSNGMLRRIHETFTAEELLCVELVLHNPESALGVARSGRALGREARRVSDTQGTIACLSGYLVNMVDRSIALLSPCNASERWPLGYRVHARGRFESAEGFRAFLEETAATGMPLHLRGGDPLAFRPGIEHASTGDGFALSSRFTRQEFSGGATARRLGQLVSAGGASVGEAIGTLAGEGLDVLAATTLLQSLYDCGVLHDELSGSWG